MRREYFEVKTKIDTLTILHSRTDKEYYPIDDLKGKIPNIEFNKLDDHEWPLLLGYDSYTLKILVELIDLNINQLIDKLKAALGKWLEFKRQQSQNVDYDFIRKKGINPNRIIRTIHIIGWLLNYFEFGDMGEKEISLLVEKFIDSGNRVDGHGL